MSDDEIVGAMTDEIRKGNCAIDPCDNGEIEHCECRKSAVSALAVARQHIGRLAVKRGLFDFADELLGLKYHTDEG